MLTRLASYFDTGKAWYERGSWLFALLYPPLIAGAAVVSTVAVIDESAPRYSPTSVDALVVAQEGLEEESDAILRFEAYVGGW